MRFFIVFCFALIAPFHVPAEVTNAIPARLDRNQLLVYRNRHGVPQPVKSVRDWEKRRAEIVHGMESVMGPLPGREKRCPLDVKVEQEIDSGSFVRRLINLRLGTRLARPGMAADSKAGAR